MLEEYQKDKARPTVRRRLRVIIELVEEIGGRVGMKREEMALTKKSHRSRGV